MAEIGSVLRHLMNETGKKIVIFSESFAAVSQTKNKPISTKVFKRKANDPNELMPDWQSAVTLSAYDIEIYGLENYKTDPTQKCKSAKDIDKFLQTLDPELLKKHHQRELERFLNGSITEDDYIYSGIRTYMLTSYRSIIPNEVFSSYIHLMDDDVISIVCVGSSHIPALWDAHENLIEQGMLDRISVYKKCSATFITRANSPISGHYHPEPEGKFHYSAIGHVSCESTLSIGDVLIYEIKHHIHRLQGHTKNLSVINQLEALVNKFEEYQYDEDMTVGFLLQAWEHGIRSERFKSHHKLESPYKSNNPTSIFSKKKDINSIQQLLNYLKQCVGDYPLSMPYKEIDDIRHLVSSSSFKK